MKNYSAQLKRISVIIIFIVITISLLVIAGWAFHIELLVRLFPNFPPMVFNTSLGFLFSALALLLLEKDSSAWKAVRFFCVLPVIAISVITLAEYYFNLSFSIDELLLKDFLVPATTAFAGRPSENTAFVFLLVSTALFLLSTGYKHKVKLTNYFVYALLLITLPSLVSYFQSVDFLLGVTAYNSMALHTTLSFMLLAVAILFKYPAQNGITKILVSEGNGGKLARRIYATIFLVPLCVGIMVVAGRETHLFSKEFGGSLFLAVNFILFVVIFLVSLSSLEKAEEELDRHQRVYETIATHLPNGIVRILDRDLRYVFSEGEELHRLGLVNEDLIGKTVVENFGEETARQIIPYYEKVLAGEKVSFEKEISGDTFLVNASPIFDRNENVNQILSLAINITERKKRQEEISRLNEELKTKADLLEAANKELEAFSYSVSHDLRAPLRHMTGFIELIKANNSFSIDEKGRRHFSVLSDSSKKLGMLIDDLLALSRIGRARLNCQVVNTNELVEDCLKLFESQIKTQNINIKIETLQDVYADSTLIRLVFQNLISNAVKYTRKTDKPLIEISNIRHNGDVLFCVKDNGAGFDMKYVDKLFGVFQRLHSESEFEGTGIGLANVLRIIQKHNGRIWAEAEVGKGASFYFTIQGTDVS